MLRDQLRGGYGERIQFLNQVVDGTVMQTIEVPLISVLPHVVCPNCGEHGQEPKDGVVSLLTVTFTAKASASVKDRIMALEQMAKYGLGQMKEVSVESVRERVQETLRRPWLPGRTTGTAPPGRRMPPCSCTTTIGSCRPASGSRHEAPLVPRCARRDHRGVVGFVKAEVLAVRQGGRAGTVHPR
jgi:hypothetical protein